MGSLGEGCSLLTAPNLSPQTPILRLTPNPTVQGRVRIEFDLVTPSNVSLDVFDALGRLVATPIGDVLPAGYHVVGWVPSEANGRVAAGVYFVRLRANDKDVQGRIVVR
jgi:hypothetical protein